LISNRRLVFIHSIHIIDCKQIVATTAVGQKRTFDTISQVDEDTMGTLLHSSASSSSSSSNKQARVTPPPSSPPSSSSLFKGNKLIDNAANTIPSISLDVPSFLPLLPVPEITSTSNNFTVPFIEVPSSSGAVSDIPAPSSPTYTSMSNHRMIMENMNITAEDIREIIVTKSKLPHEVIAVKEYLASSITELNDETIILVMYYCDELDGKTYSSHQTHWQEDRKVYIEDILDLDKLSQHMMTMNTPLKSEHAKGYFFQLSKIQPALNIKHELMLLGLEYRLKQSMCKTIFSNHCIVEGFARMKGFTSTAAQIEALYGLLGKKVDETVTKTVPFNRVEFVKVRKNRLFLLMLYLKS